MKTLVSLYQSYPPESGAASVTYHLARFMSGERQLIQLGPLSRLDRPVDGLEIRTIAAPAESRWRKFRAFPRILKNVAEEVSRAKPEIVVLEGASWAVYLYFLARRLRLIHPSVRIVYHAHNVEFILRRQKNGFFLAWMTRQAEKRLLGLSDAVFAASAVDAADFRLLYGVEAQSLPNAIDAAVLENPPAARAITPPKENRDVLFMGLPAYPPNTAAIRFLVEEVFPLVLIGEPNARLVISGGAVLYQRPWLYSPGLIPFQKLPDFIRSCHIGVAPIFSGSGTRLKILEYMAASLPVVATAKGAEGLAITPGQNILLREDAAGFAEAILSLFSDDPLAESIGKAGRRLVEERYDWRRIVSDFEISLAQLSASGPRPL